MFLSTEDRHCLAELKNSHAAIGRELYGMMATSTGDPSSRALAESYAERDRCLVRLIRFCRWHDQKRLTPDPLPMVQLCLAYEWALTRLLMTNQTVEPPMGDARALEKQWEILEAMVILLKQGRCLVSLGEIATAAKSTADTVNKHFPTYAHLLVAAIERLMGDFENMAVASEK